MDSVSLTRLLLSSSVIPVHASMLYLACPSLRAMAVAPAASGLTSWKFVLSNHVTDAAVRTYFSFLYTPNHLSFGFSNQIFIYFPPPVPLQLQSSGRSDTSITSISSGCKSQSFCCSYASGPCRCIEPAQFASFPSLKPQTLSRNTHFHVDHGLSDWAP